MADKTAESIGLSEVRQVGIIVRDSQKVADYLENVIGLPPFRIADGPAGPGIKAKLAFSQAGAVEVELIQITEGESIHTDFFKEHGEGIHHISFFVQDFDRAIEDFAKRDIGIMMQGVSPRGIRYAFMDTAPKVGFIFEIIEREN